MTGFSVNSSKTALTQVISSFLATVLLSSGAAAFSLPLFASFESVGVAITDCPVQKKTLKQC